MKHLPSPPKGIFLPSLKISAFALAFSVFSCKSEKTISSAESIADSVLVSSMEQVDSLELLQLIRQKEAAIQNYRATSERKFDLLHTDLDLSFNWENQSVIGKAILRLKPFFYPQKTLVLDAKDFELGAISLVNGENLSKLNYGYNEKVVEIYLPQEYTSQDTLEVMINYTAFPNRNSGGGSQAITDTKGLYFIDPLDTIPGKPRMIWTQGETEHNSKWFPTIDRPNERFTQLIKLTVPDSLVSVSNGELIKQESLGNGLRKDHWEMKLPHAPYLAAIAIGDFGKVESSAGKIPLGYYVEKGYEKGAAIVFGNTPEMISFFEGKLGVAYPWPKYDQIVVRDFVSGAMENTTASIFMENLLLDEREAIDSEWDYIIAHELFHQWFGDYVTSESWSNLTLNEAFANYSEYLWNEYKYGKDEAAMKLITEMEGYFNEAENKVEDLIRFTYADSEDMFDAHSYNKGGVILHMLRNYLGDEAFFKALNIYLEQHAFQAVEVHDLRLAFEKVSGKDLNWFFNQWFLEKGHPELYFYADYSQPENVLITVVQAQDMQEYPLFQFPLEVSWYEGKERRTKTVQVNQAYQQFSLENSTPLSQVYFDEGKNLLARRFQGSDANYFLKQFKESQLGVARYEALDSLISKEANGQLEEIIPLALKDPFWSVRESALLFLQKDPNWSSKLPQLEEMILSIANSDPKNSVRSGALDLLSTWDADKFRTVFLAHLEEPSYLVSGSALAGLVQAKATPLEISFLERFEGDPNFRIVIPLAEYYLEQSISGKGDWFQTKIESLKAEGLYYFLGYYGEYFSKLPEEGQEKAVETLLRLMGSSSQNYVRLGAFQALMGFADQEETLKKVKAIAAKEQDPQVKNYFEYFMEVLSDEN